MVERGSYHSYFGVRCRRACLEGSRSLKAGGAEAVEGHFVEAAAGTLVVDSG